MVTDAHNLQRFVEAQEPVYAAVLDELARGHKTGHWMWFIFPQIRGLAVSATSDKYAIGSMDEAVSYIRHPILGRRLEECTNLVLDLKGFPIEQVFAYPDYLKFRSCMTLFSQAVGDDAIYERTLQKYFGGRPDQRTLTLLAE